MTTGKPFPQDFANFWDHQLQALGMADPRKVKNFALLMDPGTGKTLIVITLLRTIFAIKKQVENTLILCPAIALDNWQEEIAKFSKIPDKKVMVLQGPVKKRIEKARKQLAKGPMVFITNYDAIGSSKEFAEFLEKEVAPVVFVADESHRCKSHNTNSSVRTEKIARGSEYKYIMTGTVQPNTQFDLFMQFLILDGGESFGRSYFSFRKKYFYDANFGMPKDKHFPNWKIQKGAEQEISAILARKAIQAKKEDCLDLPEYVKTYLKVDMTPEQKRAYAEMKKHLITIVNDKAVTAEIAMVKSMRLLQIATGFVKDEEGNVHYLKNNRQKALKELLSDVCIHSGKKAIIWAIYEANYEQIREVCDSLKIKYIEAHGKVRGGTKQNRANAKTFNDDSSISVLIGHPKSLGIAINLKSASHSIYYSRSFSMVDYDQSKARNYRGGSIEFHDKITEVVMQTRDSVDETIDTALEGKYSSAEEIMKLIKKAVLD